MKYNFDEVIDRSNSDCSKIENLKPLFGRDDIIPLWVADMDFKAPPAITQALMKRVEHGVFGYTVQSEEYFNSIINWHNKRYNWIVNKEDINYIPGVVKGFSIAIEVFTEVGDNIIIQPPVYNPIRIMTKALNRKVEKNWCCYCWTWALDFHKSRF